MKLQLANLIFTLLVCSSSLLLKAQVVKPGLPNDLDKMFIPDKSSIFNSEAKKNESSSHSTIAIDVKHIVKFNIAMLSRSIAAFYYERRLTDHLGLEGGLGIVFDKDRIMGATAGRDALSTNNTSISLDNLMYFNASSGKSLFASLSFRAGWESLYDWNALPYFAFNTRYYANKLEINKNERGTINGSPDVTIRNISYNLIYGQEFFTEGKIKTTHDFYIGFGMRSTSFDKFTVTQVNGPQGPEPLHTKTTQRITLLSSTFILGYVFGIGF